MTIITETDLLKYRRTKIIATIGPNSRSSQVIGELIAAGVSVFRINMSHGGHAEHREAIGMIRVEADRLQQHTAILADLCGPKIRMGIFKEGAVELVTGARVTVTTRDVAGDAALVPSQYKALPEDVRPGDRILLNDGAAELRVLSVSGPDVSCEVIAGGMVGDRKGINLPGVSVSAPSLTAKDRADAEFALGEGVDFMALSFVRCAQDILELRELMDRAGRSAQIIAKIEKPEALKNSSAIIDAADGIMIARGDLGVELNPEQVPLAQSQLITRARSRDKPVIVATQMLESMITNARPTRAEVSDVSLAVSNAADAVMLSGETAVGRYPVASVSMMSRIARQTESYHWHHDVRLVARQTRPVEEVSFGNAVADATARLVADVRARAVIVISMHGITAATISAARPAAPVVAVARDAGTCRRMSLMWGVIPHIDDAAGNDNPNDVARRAARALGLAEPGQFVVLVRGFHAEQNLNTPTITLLTL